MTGPRILIIMSHTGGGHHSAALALQEGLLQLAPEAEITLADIFGHLPFPLSRLGGLYEPIVQHSQGLWRLVWDLTHTPERAEQLIKVIAPLGRPTLRQLLQDHRPNVVVSVYPLCVHALAQARRELRLAIPQITVVIDLVSIHPTWLCPEATYCIVPTERAQQQALDSGLPPDCVKLLGVPVGLRFGTCQQEKRALRSRLGLDTNVWTLLLMGGAEGVGPLSELVRALDEADLPLQLLVVAGHNERLRRQMAQIPWRKSVRLFGFTRQVWHLMGASDLLLTKGGSVTISEGLSAGLPIAIIEALPGQEQGNAEYIVSHGAGLPPLSPRVLAAEVQELLTSGRERLEEMRTRAKELARPWAALEIAQLILQQAAFHNR